MRFETSWDDNCPQNQKILDLLLKYKLPGIFYLPFGDLDTGFARSLVNIHDTNYKIGCHSFTHPHDMKTLTYPELYRETITAKERLEELVEVPIYSYCYPRGRYNDTVIEVLRKNGFAEARTTKVLVTEKDWPAYEKPTTIHFFDRKEYEGENLITISKNYFNKAKAENGYFHLWGHGWEIEKNNLWGALEEVLAYIALNL